MVRFMYVGSIEEDEEDEDDEEDGLTGEDLAKLLVLAHRYAIAGLVTSAANELMGHLDADNIVEIMRMLRAYADDPLLKPVFLSLMATIQSEPKLLHSIVTAI